MQKQNKFHSDFFLSYTEIDLKYEFKMLIGCKTGCNSYTDPFLKNLCLEGWLLHARRIIESFRLDTIDEKWNKRWGLISEHLSHAKPANRQDKRPQKKENYDWDLESYHSELIEDLHKIAAKHKSKDSNYDLLIEILNNAKNA